MQRPPKPEYSTVDVYPNLTLQAHTASLPTGLTPGVFKRKTPSPLIRVPALAERRAAARCEAWPAQWLLGTGTIVVRTAQSLTRPLQLSDTGAR
jgi:hypothetical protein